MTNSVGLHQVYKAASMVEQLGAGGAKPCEMIGQMGREHGYCLPCQALRRARRGVSTRTILETAVLLLS